MTRGFTRSSELRRKCRGDTLPPEGREVEPTQYWQRRVNDGDVAEAVADTSKTKKEA